MDSDLGQEAQRQRGPSQRPFLFLSLPHSSSSSRENSERKFRQSSPLRPLSSPHSAPPSASFFVFLFSLISPFPFSPRGHYFLLIPFPQPLLTPDTTKSAACGFNGNQTMSHSPLVCRLLFLYNLISSWLCLVSA